MKIKFKPIVFVIYLFALSNVSFLFSLKANAQNEVTNANTLQKITRETTLDNQESKSDSEENLNAENLNAQNAQNSDHHLYNANLQLLKEEEELRSHIKNWKIHREINQEGRKICHAIASPIKTKVYDSIRNAPYFVITYIYPNTYTISLYAGFVLDKKHRVTISTNEQKYTLKPTHGYFAYSYDNLDDARLMNDMMIDRNYAEIRSFDAAAGLAVDYYALEDLPELLIFMHKHCRS